MLRVRVADALVVVRVQAQQLALVIDRLLVRRGPKASRRAPPGRACTGVLRTDPRSSRRPRRTAPAQWPARRRQRPVPAVRALPRGWTPSPRRAAGRRPYTPGRTALPAARGRELVENTPEVDRSVGLERRVVREVEAALTDHGYASPVDVLTGLGWLHPRRVQSGAGDSSTARGLRRRAGAVAEKPFSGASGVRKRRLPAPRRGRASAPALSAVAGSGPARRLRTRCRARVRRSS